MPKKRKKFKKKQLSEKDKLLFEFFDYPEQDQRQNRKAGEAKREMKTKEQVEDLQKNCKVKHFPFIKSREIIPANIKEEIDRQQQENERREIDYVRRQHSEDTKNKKLEKKIKKASRRKAQNQYLHETARSSNITSTNPATDGTSQSNERCVDKILAVSPNTGSKVSDGLFDNHKKENIKTLRSIELQRNMEGKNVFERSLHSLPSLAPQQQNGLTLKQSLETLRRGKTQSNTHFATTGSALFQPLKPLSNVKLPLSKCGNRTGNIFFLCNEGYRFSITQACGNKLLYKDVNQNSNTYGNHADIPECSDSNQASVSYFSEAPNNSLSNCQGSYHPSHQASQTDTSKHVFDMPQIQDHPSHSSPSDNLLLERYSNSGVLTNCYSEHASVTQTSSQSSLSYLEMLVNPAPFTQTEQQQIQKVMLTDSGSTSDIKSHDSGKRRHYQSIHLSQPSLPASMDLFHGDLISDEKSNNLMKYEFSSSSKYKQRSSNKMDELASIKLKQPQHTNATGDYQYLPPCSKTVILTTDVQAKWSQPVCKDEITELVHLPGIPLGGYLPGLCDLEGYAGGGVYKSSSRYTSNDSSDTYQISHGTSLNSKIMNVEVTASSLKDFVPDHWDDGVFNEDDNVTDSNCNCEGNINTCTIPLIVSDNTLPTETGVKRHVNHQKVVTDLLKLHQSNNNKHIKVINDDSRSDRLMSALDSLHNKCFQVRKIEFHNSGKAISKQFVCKPTIKMQRKQETIDKRHGVLPKASKRKDITSELEVIMKRIDLKSSRCHPVDQSRNLISTNLMQAMETSNDQKMIKTDSGIEDNGLAKHNFPNNTEVVSTRKNPYFQNLRGACTSDQSLQSQCNLPPHSSSKAGAVEMKISGHNSSTVCEHQEDCKVVPFTTPTCGNVCGPPPGLTLNWPAATQQLLNSYLPIDILSAQDSLYAALALTVLDSYCSQPIASNSLATDPNLNLLVLTMQHQQKRLFLLMCDLQAKIMQLASTWKPNMTLKGPLAKAVDETTARGVHTKTETLSSNKELSISQIGAILDKLLTVNTECINSVPENTFADLTIQSTCAQAAQNICTFPSRHLELNKQVYQTKRSDTGQNNILKRFPVLRIVKQKFHLQ